MPLSAGSHLGPYEILSPIGAGGMGEVYRARDTRLDRTVAIKVLAEHLSGKPQLRERFEREARAVSSLNHPHICTLHDVGQQDGADFLVMEYLEGETLAQRLKKGPLPLDQALRYAVEIARALDHAHRHGVVHRDLKPGNIMLTKSGAKVLDFGLAKVGAGFKPTQAETQTLTEEGVILGTLQYMAPEQLEGKEADARTDIFAFGAVIYEMATGKKAFEGKGRASLIAAIMEHDPAPITTLQILAPAALDAIVKRCLAKTPEERWQGAGDIGAALELVSPAFVAAPQAKSSRLAWLAAAVLALALAIVTFTRKPPEGAVTRLSFSPPVKTDLFAQLAISPDGRRVAFGATTASGGWALWLRSLDSFTARELPGTEQAGSPFWSPDGRFIGFLADGKLKKIDVGGAQSSVQTICPVASPRAGGAWGSGGDILFQTEENAAVLYRVPASGGTPVPATKLHPDRQEINHRWPQFLPDGRHFLHWTWSAKDEYTGIYLASLDPAENLADRGPLVRTWRGGAYAEGHLLFLQGATLFAQQLDIKKLRLDGEPQGLPERVATHSGWAGLAFLSLSSHGELAYLEAAPEPGQRLVWLDRAGQQVREIEAPPLSSGLRLAPDGKRLALDVRNDHGIEDVWVMDLERGTFNRLTAGSAASETTIWSPNGARIAFSSNRRGVYDFYVKDAGGGGAEELLAKSERSKFPDDWSPDGRFILYEMEYDPKTKGDLWVLPLTGDRKPFPFLNTEFNEGGAKFSPVPDAQGRIWVVYASDETGRPEIYLRPFTPDVAGGAAAAKVRVSTAGGSSPLWRKDGRELFYFADGKLIAADVKLGAAPEIGVPHRLFNLPPNVMGFGVFADGQRFVSLVTVGELAPAKFNVVLNWQAELKR